ncbi:MAG: diaminopimelate epimerase [Phycisphaerae bacterium]
MSSAAPTPNLPCMPLAFTKMHGLGNDYVYVDCTRQPLGALDRAAAARAMSDRHRGIGSDGLILIDAPTPGVHADVRMEMYNADGSRGEMCGNGIRCVGLFALAHGLVPRGAGRAGRVRVQTDGGVRTVDVEQTAGRAARVRVNMGRPILAPHEIPVLLAGQRCLRAALDVAGRALTMTCVSMGNPHAVFFVAHGEAQDLESLGPQIERHAVFPNRVNVHFAVVVKRDELELRTWERGAGLTQACGSGACATVVAGVLEGRLGRRVLCHLPGGDLEVEWPDDGGDVFMTGPAEEVFSGTWPT